MQWRESNPQPFDRKSDALTTTQLRHGLVQARYIVLTKVMPSSHRRYGHDKTVLSRLVGVGGVNWIGDKSRLSETENFETEHVWFLAV